MPGYKMRYYVSLQDASSLDLEDKRDAVSEVAQIELPACMSPNIVSHLQRSSFAGHDREKIA